MSRFLPSLSLKDLIERTENQKFYFLLLKALCFRDVVLIGCVVLQEAVKSRRALSRLNYGVVVV